MQIRPVILSGGSGTRLWPVSRQKLPKQFAPLLPTGQARSARGSRAVAGTAERVMSSRASDGNLNNPTYGGTLFVQTLNRFSDRALFLPPIIIGNKDHQFLIRDGLDDAGIKDATVFLEPVGRNTAAAALAALFAEKETGDVLHLVVPSDHVITDHAAFLDAIGFGAAAAGRGNIVLFGITPSRAETGFGYIVPGTETAFEKIQKIASFKEKPDAENAEKLIKTGALWNSGIFMYAPETLLKEAQRLIPETTQSAQSAVTGARTTGFGTMLDQAAYATIKDQPFDRAIMERTDLGMVVPASMGWSDLGSWQSLWQTGDQDKGNNVAAGPTTLRDSHGCYVRSDGPLVATIGLNNMAVIATKDAVLVAPLDRTQEVKDMVATLNAPETQSIVTDHTAVRRPWGSYESLAQGAGFQVKHIVVQPGQALSLQMHHHRAEHWIVVSGTATVECDGIVKTLEANQSTYIPKESKHRLSNSGTALLHLIEVQSGNYLGEDDIVRFEDVYGRGNESPPETTITKKSCA